MSSIEIVVLGIVLGPLAFLALHWTFNRIYPQGAGESVTGRQLAQILLATAAACLAFGVVLIVPLILFGLYPLGSNLQLFGWSFLIGTVVWVFGMRLWHHIRNLRHARNTDS